jgi:predicted DNA-binding transcriptional regulator YafY
LRRLQRGSASKRDLIEAALTEVDREVYGGDVSQKALDKRFEADKERLADLFGVELRYRRSTNTYEIAQVWKPLLDLPNEALSAIAFLQSTFSPAAPQSEQVQNLLSLLQTYLPLERQGELIQQRTALEVEWGQRDSDDISPDVEAGLNRAVLKRRLIAFDYYSPRHPDRQPRRHTVEPWQRYFDSVRGHHYLRGYCRRVVEPGSEARPNRYLTYRLGRIANLELLPQKLPPFPPPSSRVELTYRLAPEIARLGDVTQHPGITILKTKTQPDDSIIVHAQTNDLWRATRSLLHYGATCRVIGGGEALAEMRRMVKEMAEIYELISGEE